MRFRVRIILLCCLLPNTLTTALATTDSAEDILASERQQYDAALKAVNKGRWTEYEQLRPGLEEYPLAMYLDYYQLSRQSSQVRHRSRGRAGNHDLRRPRSQDEPDRSVGHRAVAAGSMSGRSRVECRTTVEIRTLLRAARRARPVRRGSCRSGRREGCRRTSRSTRRWFCLRGRAAACRPHPERRARGRT